MRTPLRTLVAAFALVVSITAVGIGHAGQIVIKAGYGTAGGPIHEGMIEFEKRIEAANPNIDVQLFPGGQLGSEGEIVGQLQAGITDMLPTTTGPLGRLHNVFYALEPPYELLNETQADTVLDGPIGEKMLQVFDSKGLVGLTFWENGFRQATNSVRPIVTPEDFKGIKFRVQQSTLHINFFKALGANPTPLPFTEIYNSLATKVVDGQENPLSLIATNKFYEQQKYLSKTDHVYSAVPVYFSKMKWMMLPPDVQKLVKDTVHDLRIWQRQRGRQMENEYIADIKQKCEVTILTDEHKQAFKDAGAEVYEWANKEFGPDYQEVLSAIAAATK
ncbi:MAG: DctP family TRAP transporter solute-binding subunit [Planctomycetaceae bacterium]|nr:DctP family TRAP transporter solute-binding subunit [Planctomycetaceae bacterium]